MIFFFLIQSWIKQSVTNNVDPDQTPHSAASELGLHCLHMSHKMDAWLILVNFTTVCA